MTCLFVASLFFQRLYAENQTPGYQEGDHRYMVHFCQNTPGNIYEISVEHHKYHEVLLDNVENWSFFGLQPEEDTGSEKALAVEINNCRNILFANLRSHRTSGVWEPYFAGVLLSNSNDITIKGLVEISVSVIISIPAE